MAPQTEALFEAVLALSEAERSLLLDRLLDSLAPEGDEGTDAELAAELDRRFAEYQQDPSTAVLWSEIRRPIK